MKSCEIHTFFFIYFYLLQSCKTYARITLSKSKSPFLLNKKQYLSIQWLMKETLFHVSPYSSNPLCALTDMAVSMFHPGSWQGFTKESSGRVAQICDAEQQLKLWIAMYLCVKCWFLDAGIRLKEKVFTSC